MSQGIHDHLALFSLVCRFI